MQPASISDPLIAERTYDTDFIKSVVLSLRDTVAEDGFLRESWVPEVVGECWLNIHDMAVYHLRAENSTTLNMHAYVLMLAPLQNRGYLPLYPS